MALLRRMLVLAAFGILMVASALASENSGRVTFNGLPVPGATVTLSQQGKNVVATTDGQGLYSFPDVADGAWSISVEMLGFATIHQQVTVAAGASPATWELKLLSLAEIREQAHPLAATATLMAANPASSEVSPQPTSTPQPPPAKAAAQSSNDDDDQNQRSADGLLINGSSNNADASQFGMPGAFGNNRFGNRKLYNGGIGLVLDNSALDASPYSLAGQQAPKPSYNRTTGVFTVGGPLQIPHLLNNNGPFVFIAYQWTRNNNVTTQSALMPTADERNGIFSAPIIDPSTGLPFSGNSIPQSRISSQAASLLKLYPLPNVAGNARYNYQAPLLSPTHRDALQTRVMKAIGHKDQVFGSFAFQSDRSSNPNVFGFLDRSSSLGLNTDVNWTHRLSTDWFFTTGYQFSRFASRVTPYFANRQNISGDAGIQGNNRDPSNWGPPALTFASGIAGLSDAKSSFERNQTSGFSYEMSWSHRAHNLSFGTDFKRREFNVLSQQDPRGAFTFTGAVTGSAFGDFLLGVPDTSSIAFGNPDKYFRQSLYDAFVVDDWHFNSALTLNLGVRWEYGAPITELRGRLVNLDIASGFTGISPVVASSPTGTLTGQTYPDSLVRPDKNGFSPRIGLAWKPIAGSSLVVRAGYGIYYDTSVYQSLATQMAQQPPLSKTLSVQNSPANPLTLADGFHGAGSEPTNTFAVNPNFRVGYAQNWNLSVQHDLPGSLQLTATYLGIKGTRAVQALLPNSYPVGALDPCPSCPSGFVYLTSGANSSREAAQIQLRRRLHSGFGGSLQYTFSKSMDDAAALGGPGASNASPFAPSRPTGSSLAIAQNWLNPAAERGLSAFDQRHVLSLNMQYTTGMGLAGGTLLEGWRGGLFKDWTVSTQISAASGLPQTPVYLVPVPGTGVTGTIRPDYTGAPIYTAPAGLFLNPAAYVAPPPGQWGNAGRDSIAGPMQFGLNASLARTFRVRDRYNLDLRFDSTNLLNHVTYSGWNTTINSATFGLPVAANAMRSVQTTLRLRF